MRLFEAILDANQRTIARDGAGESRTLAYRGFQVQNQP